MTYRLHHKSCYEMDEIATEAVNLTVTSPPYWNAIDYDIHTTDDTANHRQRDYGGSLEDYFSEMDTAFSEVYRTTCDGGFCCIVIGTILDNARHYPLPHMLTVNMLNLGWEFADEIIWNKVTGGVKRAGSFIKHQKMGYYYPNIMTEHILIFRKPGERIRGTEPELPIDDLFKKDIANSIWHIAPVPPRTINHPCPFPVELARRLVLLYSCPEDTVLDPFCGAGTTGVAALQNNRDFIGYDIEEKYIQLSNIRLQNPEPPRKNNLLPAVVKLPV